MPPIWVHFFLGLAGCALVGWWVRKYRVEGAAWPFFAFGLLWGSVAPDTDLLLSSLVSAAMGFDTEAGKFLHRTMTHGLPLVAFLLLAGALTWGTRPRAAGFIMGLAGGVLVFHILPDLWYLVAVKVYAPVSFEEVGPFAIGHWHFWKSDFSDTQNNIINGVDFAGDSLAYLATWLLARRFGVLESRFVRALPWIALVNAAIFVTITVLVASSTTYDEFLIWTYTPGVVFIALSTIVVPWKARATFLRVGGSPPGASTNGPRA